MGLPRFCFPDFSQPSATVTPVVTGSVGWVDLANLQGDVLSEMAHWPAASAASVTIDLGAPRGVGVIAIPKHTAQPGNTVRVRLATDVALTNVVLDTGVQEFWPRIFPWGSLPWGDPRFADGRITLEDAAGYNLPWTYSVPSQVVGQYLRADFDFSGNPNGCADVAKIVVSPGIQPRHNFSWGWQIGWTDDSQRKRSLGGVDFVDARPTRRTLAISLNWLEAGEAYGPLWELDRLAGTKKPFFFIVDDADVELLYKRSMMVIVDQLEPFANPSFNRHTKNYKLTEVI